MARRETDEELAARGIDRWGFPLPLELRLVPAEKPAEVVATAAGSRQFNETTLLPGLRRLCERALPGQRHSLRKIAAECDVSEAAIRKIQHKALRKVRTRLGTDFRKQLAETVAKFDDADFRHLPAA